jgi:hypothetical protein
LKSLGKYQQFGFKSHPYDPATDGSMAWDVGGRVGQANLICVPQSESQRIQSLYPFHLHTSGHADWSLLPFHSARSKSNCGRSAITNTIPLHEDLSSSTDQRPMAERNYSALNDAIERLNRMQKNFYAGIESMKTCMRVMDVML